MPTPKQPAKDAPASFTMDDIARKFLNTAPAPKPQAKPAAKPKRKTNKPAK
jgi:hypothetical protein